MLSEISEKGLTKTERLIDSRQGTQITLANGKRLINMCANNYLGLSGDPSLIEAAKAGLDRWGFVFLLCGSSAAPRDFIVSWSSGSAHLSVRTTRSCIRPALMPTPDCSRPCSGEQDAMISDELNHASIIDGIRLCKAKRFRYRNNDMVDLKNQLGAARNTGARTCLIATDGVFSMDGSYASLPAICDLADTYNALVMVDDSHAARIGRSDRARDTRTLWRPRPDRHPDRYIRQSTWRRQRRLHQRAGVHRYVAGESPLPVFQLGRTAHRVGTNSSAVPILNACLPALIRITPEIPNTIVIILLLVSLSSSCIIAATTAVTNGCDPTITAPRAPGTDPYQDKKGNNSSVSAEPLQKEPLCNSPLLSLYMLPASPKREAT